MASCGRLGVWSTLAFLCLISIPACVVGVRIEITPSHHGRVHVLHGDNVVLNCTIVGLAVGESHDLAWHYNKDSRGDNVVTLPNSNIIQLSLPSVEIDEAGTYICLSRKYDTFADVTLEVDYRSDGSAVKISPAGPVYALLGSAVKINCSIPKTHNVNFDLEWKYPVHMSEQQRVYVHYKEANTLQMSISQLQPQDEGLYTCVSKRYGSRTVFLHVILVHTGVQINETRVCSRKQFQCHTGHCIYIQYRCDRFVNCPDASDEISCSSDCGRKFRCDNGRCISASLVCDRFHNNDCLDNSDERNCIRSPPYIIQNTVTVSSVDPGKHVTHSDQQDHALTWLMSTIYSVLGIIVGLVCLLAILVIIMCRIRLRREAFRTWTHAPRSGVPRGARRNQRPVWQYSTPYNLSPEVPHYTPSQRMLRSTNVALNINLQVGQDDGVTEAFLAPPPYTESSQHPVPHDDIPPPPYSTLDRPIARRMNRSSPCGEEVQITEERVRFLRSGAEAGCLPEVNNNNNNNNDNNAVSFRRGHVTSTAQGSELRGSSREFNNRGSNSQGSTRQCDAWAVDFRGTVQPLLPRAQRNVSAGNSVERVCAEEGELQSTALNQTSSENMQNHRSINSQERVQISVTDNSNDQTASTN